MKKIWSFFVSLGLILTMAFSLSACGDNAKPTTYYINSEGNLIVVLDNGKENDLGSWGEDIIASFKSITISDDGYYIIDGIKTKISLGESFVNGITNIEISEDGFYVVNGVKTDISAINVYIVSFDTGFSTKIQDQKVKDGHRVEKPSLSRTGYILDGWYCNDEEWRFNSDVVKSNMSLTAKWHAKKYTIIFDEDGGEDVSDTNLTYDSNYTLPSTVKSLYTFGGWMLNNQVINNTGIWRIDGDETITLKAKWTRTTHNVIFDSNGGSSVQNLVVDSYTQVTTLPIPSWEDHTFLGWKNGDSC